MAKIFISYSTKDKEFARKLVRDLTSLGHEPWLDEWEIKIGECIISKVELGIDKSDYVIIVLSKDSVASGWVEREWKTKYWEEIKQGRTLVFPVLIEDCDIPTLLRTKKYADFRDNYSVALVELMSAISPTITKPQLRDYINKSSDSEIANLITKVQSRSIPLSQCIAEILIFARQRNNSSLVKFCSGELTGWDKDKTKDFMPKYRVAQVYVSISRQINMQYIGWGGNASAALDFIKNDTENFTPTKLLFPQSISTLEAEEPSDPSKGLLSVTMKASNFIPNFSDPDYPVQAYASCYTYRNILEAIRQELTQRLVDLLPQLESK